MIYKKIMEHSAALLNDQDRAVYDDITQLPYLNMARMELEEIFELNNVPVTNETSAIIPVAAGITSIGFSEDDPAPLASLPNDLVEIRAIWESEVGQNRFTPVSRDWMWIDQELRFDVQTRAFELKLDYIKSLFTILGLSNLNDQNSIINTNTYFQFRVAGLICEFIEEDITRAQGLNSNAFSALSRSLGISVKGRQNIMTRRRPFRASFKMRRSSI